MFPALKTQVLARLDLVVEFTTLGAYGVAEDGRPLALEDATPSARAPQRGRDRCTAPRRSTGLTCAGPALS